MNLTPCDAIDVLATDSFRVIGPWCSACGNRSAYVRFSNLRLLQCDDCGAWQEVSPADAERIRQKLVAQLDQLVQMRIVSEVHAAAEHKPPPALETRCVCCTAGLTAEQTVRGTCDPCQDIADRAHAHAHRSEPLARGPRPAENGNGSRGVAHG